MKLMGCEDYRLSSGRQDVSIPVLCDMLGGYEKLLEAFMEEQFDQNMMLEIGHRLNIPAVCFMLQIMNREIKALRSKVERLQPF